MKKASAIDPNFGPVYCALYPDLAAIFIKYGYALAIHGSLKRDFDLIAVPWTAQPTATPAQIIAEITETFAIKWIEPAEEKEHGRKAYTLSIAHGECAIDLSFMPVRVSNL